MEKTKFVGKQKIEELLNGLIIEREILSKVEYNIWKSTYESVKSLSDLLEHELKNWKGDQNVMFHGGKTIFKLKEATNKFIKNCEEFGSLDEEWRKNKPENYDILDNYRKICIPLIVSVAGQLEKNNDLRLEVEKKLKEYNVPMMY